MFDGVHEFGGTVNRVQGDGVMALFGAPIAHEDHAERACLAAARMLRAVPTIPEPRFSVRIGINSGQVLVKRHLNDITYDYDVVGAAANIAHRLEQIASPNTAFLSGQTFRLTVGTIAARPLGKLELRGLSEAIETYELIGPSGRRDRWHARSHGRALSPFIGREAELALIREAQANVVAGRGEVVLLIGTAGTGKSRLVHEFLADRREAGTVVRTAATPFDRDRPFAAVVSLVRSCLALVAPAGPAEQAVAALDGQREARSDSLASPLLFVLERPVVDPDWDALDNAARQDRIARAVRDLVQAVARLGPMVLVVEDVHWIDQESLAVLDLIAQSVAAGPILLLATARPDGVPRGLRSYARRIELQPLDRAETDTLLRQLLGDGDDLAPLRRMVADRTEGTPLFIEETLQMLFEAGTLKQLTTVELARPLADIRIPESVQAVIAARIDTLAPGSRAILQIAAVIGKDVPGDLLAAVAGVPAHELGHQVLELLQLEFLFLANLPTGRGYTFKHALIQAVAYETMLARRRRQLHAEILQTLERDFPDQLDELAERLGEHAERGGAGEKAAHHFSVAGRRANAMGAHMAAIGLFDRALVTLAATEATRENAERGIDVRLGLRVALAATADLRRILRYLNEAETLARGIDDRRRLALIWISQCNMLALQDHIDRALAVGAAGLEAATELGDVALGINARFALGQAMLFAGDIAGSIGLLEEGLADLAHDAARSSAGTTGSAPVLYICCLANAHALRGNFADAHHHSDEALRLALRSGRRYDASYANLSKGIALLIEGDAQGAHTHLAEASRVCREAGIAVLAPSIARFLGLAEARCGKAAVARMTLLGAMEAAGIQGNLAFTAWCRAALSEVTLDDGDAEEAARLALLARKEAQRLGIRPVEVHATRLHAEAMGRGGDMPDADVREAIEHAFRTAQSMGLRPEAVACRLSLFRHLANLEQTAAAEAARQDAERLAASCGMRIAMIARPGRRAA
jgi:tetratricopeptide (TPR) repeat protein